MFREAGRNIVNDFMWSMSLTILFFLVVLVCVVIGLLWTLDSWLKRRATAQRELRSAFVIPSGTKSLQGRIASLECSPIKDSLCRVSCEVEILLPVPNHPNLKASRIFYLQQEMTEPEAKQLQVDSSVKLEVFSVEPFSFVINTRA